MAELRVSNELDQAKHEAGVALWKADHPGQVVPHMLTAWFRNLPDETDVARAKRILADPEMQRAIREAEEALERGETVTLEELEQEFGHG